MRRRRGTQVDFQSFITGWIGNLFKKPPFLAVDLGSTNLRIYLQGKGIVNRQKTCVVKNVKKDEFIVCGDEAYDMLGKTPPNLLVSNPIERGRVSDFDAVLYFLQKEIVKATEPYFQNRLLTRFNMLFSVPLGLTEVEEMAVVEVGKKIGAKEVFLVETPLAAGFGLKSPVMENVGTFLADIGGGTTEVSLISLGGVVLSKILSVGGQDHSRALINYLRLRYGLLIGEKTAEDLKLLLGSLVKESADLIEISGRSLESGMPKSIKIKKKILLEPLYPYFGQVLDLIKEAVEETPPELIKDLRTHGLIVSGMAANFVDLDTYFSRELKLKVATANEPEYSVIRGLGWLSEHPEALAKVMIKFSKF
jgi:rod shape-determining protein MreB and related proteins